MTRVSFGTVTKETFAVSKASLEALVIAAVQLTDLQGLLFAVPLDWVFAEPILRQLPKEIRERNT